jgi:hypothetical protein
LRKLRLLALGISLTSAPALCRAANDCAWINQATASGLLGGEAAVTVTEPAAEQPAVCTFTQQNEKGKRTLRVAVEIAMDAHARLGAIAEICGANAVPLKAIGNEALLCAADEDKNQIGERIIGRVRDQVFTITIGTTIKDDPILTRDELKSRVHVAAEQVSGNLF